jgi:hypothetical protein
MERRISLIDDTSGWAENGARLISNEIEKRVYAQVPGEDDGTLNNAVNRITATAFLYNLASPAYSLINATQVGMVTYPVLAADFNPVTAMVQLRRAYKDIGALGITAGGLADTGRAALGKMVTADRFIDDVKRKLTPDEKRMIDELAAEGLIDADGGMEIARIVDRKKGTLWGKVDAGIYYLVNIARARPGAVEAINRSVTAIAAYRMSMNKHKDHARAVQYAKDVVNDTQMLMSNSNAAPIFSKPVGRVALQFKKFGQGIYYLLGKNVGRVLRGESAEEKLRGAATLMYVAGTTQLLAGTVGLPGLELLRIGSMMLYGFGWDDENWEDQQEKLAQTYEEMFGEKIGEMMAFGVTRGLPAGWGTDLSGRLGMQNLLIFGEPAGNNDEDWKAFMWDLAFGPFGRIADNTVTGLSDIASGGALASPTDFTKALVGMIPFKLLTDSMKALRGTARGEMETPDAVLRAIGFTSGRQANISREIGQSVRDAGRRSGALRAVESAYLNARTKAEIAAATSKLREYNATLPEGDRNRRSLKSMETRRLQRMEVYENN